MWYIFFCSILASFGTYLANDYFGALSSHGVFCEDIFAFLLIWYLPQKSKFKLVLVGIALYWIFFENPVVGAFVMIAVISSFIPRTRYFPSIIVFWGVVVFLFVVDCSLLFKDAFQMELGTFYTVATFYWWGVILFFLTPSLYALCVFYFARKVLWGTTRISIRPLWFSFFLVVSLYANEPISYLQQRQVVVDFPMQKYFQSFDYEKKYHIIEGSSELNHEELSFDTKKIFDVIKIAPEEFIAPKTISILVESYGVPKDTALAKRVILWPFRKSKISLVGVMPRNAMYTQGAEFEDFGNVSQNDTAGIPLISNLKKEETESWFVHGYVETFYFRSKIYRQFGFDSLMFDKDFEKVKLNFCDYGFHGVCDTSMLTFIDGLLKRPGKDKFVYWTTLDTHPPYKDHVDLPEYSIWCKNTQISEKKCTYLSLLEQTLLGIADFAEKHPDYRIIIRGDHRPIGTINPENFYYAWVPIIVLN